MLPTTDTVDQEECLVRERAEFLPQSRAAPQKLTQTYGQYLPRSVVTLEQVKTSSKEGATEPVTGRGQGRVREPSENPDRF